MIMSNNLYQHAIAIMDAEVAAIQNVKNNLAEAFNAATTLLLSCTGKIIVTGIGKSGHIANKIAATLSSTGSPAYFMHPSEALHGDIGLLTKNDLLLVFSNSGTTEEIVKLLPRVKEMQVPIIAITNNPQAIIATSSDVHLNIYVTKEACPLGLAPTTSTTTSLIIGDALAICLSIAKGFTQTDFAKTHPAGKLGKQLTLTIQDIMHTKSQIPLVSPDTLIKDALLEVTSKGLGFTGIIEDQQVLGIFTDGDLRRTFNNNIDIVNTKISTVMTTDFINLTAATLVTDAINIMQNNNINSALVVNNEEVVVGAVNLLLLLNSGV